MFLSRNKAVGLHQRGELMKTHNVLPFKLESTEEKITSHSGLVLFGEFLHALDLPHLLDNHLPKPGSINGYMPSEFIVPLLLSIHGGGSTLEDLRVIRMDQGLRDLLRIAEFPSPDAFGDWILRCGKNRKAQRALRKVTQLITRRQLNREMTKEYTLDIDASQIVAEKQTAHITYKGELGYMPIVGHLAENGLVIGHEFREGNVSPNTRNLEFVQQCFANLSKHKKIVAFRADAASYQAALFNYLEKRDVLYAVGGHVDISVKTRIPELPESAWRPYQNGHITEIVHCMGESKKAFRLIIIRRPHQQNLPGQEETEITNDRYRVIASNRLESAEKIVAWYNKRGDASENRIKDLKNGFQMEHMPCGTFEANSFYFGVGVLAYNLHILFRSAVLPKEWKSFQIQTIRWRFYQIGGKIISHARTQVLKVAESAFKLFEEVRLRCRELVGV